MNKITEETAREYIANGGTRCPYCQSENIHVTDRDVDFHDCVCETCRKDWREHLAIIGLDDIYPDDKPAPNHEEELLDALKNILLWDDGNLPGDILDEARVIVAKAEGRQE